MKIMQISNDNNNPKRVLTQQVVTYFYRWGIRQNSFFPIIGLFVRFYYQVSGSRVLIFNVINKLPI